MATADDISMPDASPSPSSPQPQEISTSAHPPTYDLGNLLLSSTAPLPSNPTDSQLKTLATSHAQSLISTLLTSCRVHISPADKSTVLMTLPAPTTPLPREKPLPKAKEKTKWEKFAEKKGIQGKRKDTTGGKVYDEATGEWVTKWGYKGKNKEGDHDWIVEVDEKKDEGKLNGEGKSVRGEGRRERKEKAKRQERKERANERRGRKEGGGGD